MDIFSCLTKEEKKLGNLVKVNKNQIVFHEDDRCEYLAIVLSGEINITSYTLSGQEIIYNTVKKNGMFGNNLLFSKNPYYRGHVIAKTDGEIFLINKANLLKILQNNDVFLNEYLSMQADFSKSLNSQIKLLSFDSAEEKLLYYLKEKQVVEIDSVSSLAKTLYLSRETLSRLISKLAKEKRIVRKGNIIELLR